MGIISEIAEVLYKVECKHWDHNSGSSNCPGAGCYKWSHDDDTSASYLDCRGVA